MWGLGPQNYVSAKKQQPTPSPNAAKEIRETK